VRPTGHAGVHDKRGRTVDHVNITSMQSSPSKVHASETLVANNEIEPDYNHIYECSPSVVRYGKQEARSRKKAGSAGK